MSPTILESDKALLLIDFQQGFDDPSWGARNNPDAEANAARLLAHWRAEDLPIIHVRHHSLSPDSVLHESHPGSAFKPEVMPLEDEIVFTKRANSAFIGTDLEEFLGAEGIDQLVVCGLTTPHCVSTTVRMAANLGFEVTLVADATAAFAANAHTGWLDRPDPNLTDPAFIHLSALAHISDEFAKIATCDEVIAEAS